MTEGPRRPRSFDDLVRLPNLAFEEAALLVRVGQPDDALRLLDEVAVAVAGGEHGRGFLAEWVLALRRCMQGLLEATEDWGAAQRLAENGDARGALTRLQRAHEVIANTGSIALAGGDPYLWDNVRREALEYNNEQLARIMKGRGGGSSHTE